jgi:hypothetical protein
MSHEVQSTFESIESAHEFVGLLAEAVAAAKQDLEGDVQREAASKFPRRLQALRLALYNVEKLQLHMAKSRRILNDLRTLRRLLFEERTAKPAPAKEISPPIQAVPLATAPPITLVRPSSLASHTGDGSGRPAAA